MITLVIAVRCLKSRMLRSFHRCHATIMKSVDAPFLLLGCCMATGRSQCYLRSLSLPKVQAHLAQKNFRRILSISSIAQAGSCSAIIVYVGIVERTVGRNRARRWTPTQQPPENSTRLRRGHDRRPPRRRAEHLVATATTAKQAILHYN
jgi:hypothetical protein